LFSQDHESKGDRGVDVASRDVADTVCENGYTETKGNGDCNLYFYGEKVKSGIKWMG